MCMSAHGKVSVPTCFYGRDAVHDNLVFEVGLLGQTSRLNKDSSQVLRLDS